MTPDLLTTGADTILTAALDAGDRLVAALDAGDFEAAAEAVSERQAHVDALGQMARTGPAPLAALDRFRAQDAALTAILQSRQQIIAEALSASTRTRSVHARYQTAPPAQSRLDTAPR